MKYLPDCNGSIGVDVVVLVAEAAPEVHTKTDNVVVILVGIWDLRAQEQRQYS